MATAVTTMTMQELERLSRELEAAVARGDAATIASVYADDAVLMPPGFEAARGRPSVEQFWRAAFQFGLKAVTLQPQEVVAAGDLAYEIGAGTARMETPDGQATETTSKYLLVWRRQPDGVWRIAADIWNSPTTP